MVPASLIPPRQAFLPLTDDRYGPAQPRRPPQTNQPQFHFFDLLPELRLEVYEHLFLFPPRSTLHSVFRAARWVVPALGVCTEMRRAGFAMIYARNKLHFDIVSYQFASFETVAATGLGPDAASSGLHLPFLALDRRTLSVNPPEYESVQFYEQPSLPLPGSLFQPELMRRVSLTVHLGLYRDSIESLSMKIVFKLLYRLTHELMPNLDRVCLRVGAGDARKVEGALGVTWSLLASSAGGEGCYFSGKDAEARREKWLASLPEQIGRLPVKARELQLEGVSDEVFEVIAQCAKVSR